MRGSKKLRSCLCLAIAILATLLAPTAAEAGFGLESLSATTLNADSSIDLQAGSHPFAYKLSFAMNRDAESNPEGVLRDVFVDFPVGFVGNPQAVPHCATATFEGQVSLCPGNSQVGVVDAEVLGGAFPVSQQPIYNLTPPIGSPVRLGFSLTGKNLFQDGSLRPSDYGVTVNAASIPNVELQTITVTIWGVPADKAHDAQRQCVVENVDGVPRLEPGCSTDSPRAPFLTLPTSCTGPMRTTIRVDSVEDPGVLDSKTFLSRNEEGIEAGLENCEAPQFQPASTVEPGTEAADSPTGLHVDLHIPQNEDPDQLATAHLRDAVVALPPGLVVNPSAADGLGACPLEGPEGINLPKSSDPNVPEPVVVGEPAECPASSKVGKVGIKTPLLDHLVPGDVFLARQQENPFGSLLALYVALDDPISGTVVKLPGKVDIDPGTGQLTATFRNNPQLPFEDLDFNFFGGPRASLTTPSTCGSYRASAELTPWTAPEGATVTRTSSFAVSSAPVGGPCAGSEAEQPNAPAFEAGTETPLAGSYSPFVLKVSRANGSQRLAGLNLILPPGLAAKLAGATECSEAQIAAARARSNPGAGALEKAAPSCPPGSEVGVVNVGAGSGSPLYVQGHVYLAGPYKGAPLSLAIVTPAVAGPFDLGTVVVRAALFVDQRTAQVTVKSDPLPTMLAGIPLDIRSVAVKVNRQDFTLNPTSCEAMAVSGQAISATGAVAPLTNRFQVGGCPGLGFKPSLKISLKGGTTRGKHPALNAVVTYPKGGAYANIARAQVGLPPSEFLDQANLGNVCKQADLKAGTCPKSSIYGHVKAWTPLLDKPLEGPVYLGVGFGHKLPDLVADLNGQIRILLNGKVDTTKQDGLRNTFEAVPDAPVSRFVLEMKGGPKYGLLRNSENICLKPQRVGVHFVAHNGKALTLRPPLQNGCGGREAGGGRR